LAKQHDRKVRLALVAYFLLIGLTVWLVPAPNPDSVNRRTRAAQLEVLLQQSGEDSPAQQH
jgi:hypothetical protein